MEYATIDDILNTDLAGLFDGDECDDPLFRFDIFESSELNCAYEKSHSFAFARRSSVTLVIPEGEVYGEDTLFPTKRRKTERNEQEYTMDQSLSLRPTSEIILAKETRTGSISPSGTLSLFNPKQLKQQLEHTKSRLAESMERSSLSRKRLHDQIHLDQEYCPSQASKDVHSSVFSSQSGAYFELLPLLQSYYRQEHSSLHSCQIV